MSKFLAVALFGIAFTSVGSISEAGQRTVTAPNGKVHIVHDERGPVIVHRVFPPYKGIHIHSSELQRMQSGRRR